MGPVFPHGAWVLQARTPQRAARALRKPSVSMPALPQRPLADEPLRAPLISRRGSLRRAAVPTAIVSGGTACCAFQTKLVTWKLRATLRSRESNY